MKRVITLTYGVVCYGIFFATFLYLIGFLGNLIVPVTIDGEAQGSIVAALFVNACLFALFGIQHSVMARPGFKKAWTKIIPEEAERSTYVLFSSVALIVLFVFWQPMGGIVWDIQNPTAMAIMYGIFGLGWATILYTTFLINHFDLFGLRQVWLYFRGRPYTDLKFRIPSLYKVVRHPLYIGWLMAIWATPKMSIAHLFFAVCSLAYIMIAIYYEEKDLVNHFGSKYEDYKKAVPMLVPGKKTKTNDSSVLNPS
jgi:protein-S-isoprenylcysteine O-methyltransferase Ste14